MFVFFLVIFPMVETKKKTDLPNLVHSFVDDGESTFIEKK